MPHIICTGKSLSEVLLFAEHGGGHAVVYKNCSECQKQFLYTTCFFNSMNNLSSYCGLVDAKIIRASDKDLPVCSGTFVSFLTCLG